MQDNKVVAQRIEVNLISTWEKQVRLERELAKLNHEEEKDLADQDSCVTPRAPNSERPPRFAAILEGDAGFSYWVIEQP